MKGTYLVLGRKAIVPFAVFILTKRDGVVSSPSFVQARSSIDML